MAWTDTVVGKRRNVYKDAVYAVLIGIVLSGAGCLCLNVNWFRLLWLQFSSLEVLAAALVDFAYYVTGSDKDAMNRFGVQFLGVDGKTLNCDTTKCLEIKAFHFTIADYYAWTDVRKRDELAYGTAWGASFVTAVLILTVVTTLLRKHQKSLVNYFVQVASAPHKLITQILLGSLINPLLRFLSPVASVQFASLAATIVFDSIFQYDPMFLRIRTSCVTRSMEKNIFMYDEISNSTNYCSMWPLEQFSVICNDHAVLEGPELSKFWQTQLGTLTYLLAMIYAFAIQTNSLEHGKYGGLLANGSIYMVNALFRIHPILVEHHIPFIEVIFRVFESLPTIYIFGLLLLTIQEQAPRLSSALVEQISPKDRQSFVTLMAVSLVNLSVAALSSIFGVVVGRRIGTFFLVFSAPRYNPALLLASNIIIPLVLVFLLLRLILCWSWIAYQATLLKIDWKVGNSLVVKVCRQREIILFSTAN